MNQYQTFIFGSYGFDETSGVIELAYSLDDQVDFVERLTLPRTEQWHIRDPQALDRALFMLHLIGGMSYYKTCLPRQIDIRSGALNPEQAAFWNEVYTHGLGEFFYHNKIDFRSLIHFPATATSTPAPSQKDNRPVHALTPVGGGKDSIVTIELLKKGKIPQTLLRVGGHPLIDEVAHTAFVPSLTLKRALAPELFALNEQGALNGHVPITAYLSILSVVLAEIYGFSHVIFSNERSANEGNVEMFGVQINHQWSKSLRFEQMLRQYLHSSVTQNVEYISLLRPLSELHIVQLFSRMPQYFPLFTSCNANWRIIKEKPTDKWCGTCPKCAFAFVLLSAFLDKDTVLRIFNGKNLFTDATLLPLFRELLGLEGIKPFECVGTPEETAAAFTLAQRRGGWDETGAMTMFNAEAAETFTHIDAIIERTLTPSPEHCLPPTIRSLLPA